MTNAPNTPGPDEMDDPIITLEADDGTSHQCQVLDVIKFEGKEYGILLKLKDEGEDATDDDADDEEALVIMRLIEKDDSSIFRIIEDDEEFERVVAYVEQLTKAGANEVNS
ncbi:MAG: DUF1292 domain-containing protein [Cyanobacteria bacterium]|nr:DUF1292 domain-containing protein [Cyanobacteriota bacterium]